MLEVHIHTDLEAARRNWHHFWPQEGLFDLWPVRNAFHSQFNRSPFIIVATENSRFRGMLALSWIEEKKCYGHFPGEVWHGKTWLEQNKIIAPDAETFNLLVSHIPAAAEIRYIAVDPHLAASFGLAVDEERYLFYPGQYDYSFSAYMATFTGKSRKKINSELNRLTESGVSYRYNDLKDVAWMFRMNLERFKEASYFFDQRFLSAFERLTTWLNTNRMLRVTTVLINGRIAAVDIGAVWNQTYTVLAGGTHPDFPGVAKLINFHHLEWACQQRFKWVDFLCGDFNWKNRFHLTSQPLYKLSLSAKIKSQETDTDDIMAYAQ